MKKRIFSIALSLLLVFSVAVPTFANNDAKTSFRTALDVTKLALEKENELSKSTDLSSKILKDSMKDAFETKFSMGINKLSVTGPEGNQNIDLSKLKVDSSLKTTSDKNLSESSISVPASLTGTPRDFKLNLKMFISKDKFGLNIPQLFDKFYYVDLNTLINDWKNSALNEILPMDAQTAAQISTIKNSLTASSSALSLSNSEVLLSKMEAVSVSYSQFFDKYYNRAFFKKEGEAIISSNRGQIVTSKISLNLNQNLANEMLTELSTFIKTDKSLYDYYHTIYGAYDLVLEEDFSRQLVDEMASSISKIKVKDNFVYNIYVNKTNHIYRNELDAILIDETGEEIHFNLIFDTKGKDYLLDEINFDMAMTDSNYVTEGIAFIMAGDLIPKKGVTNVDFKMSSISGDSLNGTQYSQIGTAKVFYDQNKTADNFLFKFDVPTANFDIKADIINNPEAGNLAMNFKSIKFNFEGLYNLDMFMNLNFSKIDAKTVVMPPSVKLTSLSKTDLQSLLLNANENIEKLVQ